MARSPLLACLLVSACSVPNPWFGHPHGASEATTGDATSGTGETPTSDPQATTDAPSTADTSASSTSDETTDGLTVVHTSDTSTSSATTADESTSTESTESSSTTADASTGDGESSSSTMPIESDSDTEDAGLPPCDPSDLDLLACYDFENDANTQSMLLLDGSSYDHDGTANGALYPAGIEAQGLKISANTKTEVDDVETLNPQALSMAAWIKITNLPPPGGAAIIEKSGQYSLKILENPIGLTCTINGMTVAHNVSFPQDEWTHVACVYGGDQFKLYMNGQAVKDGLHGGNVAVGFNPLHVGCGGPACQFRLIGAILDRVRLWKGALPQNILCAEANAC